MKAIVVKPSDKAPVLSWQEVADVTCGPEQVLVDIKATAVNRTAKAAVQPACQVEGFAYPGHGTWGRIQCG